MAQQLKTLAIKPNVLSLVPGSPKVEGENRLPQVSSDIHAMVWA